MFSDCYQMRTWTTIQHSYIILTFNTCVFALFLFLAVGFLCSGFSMCLEPCILGQRVKAPFWRLWRVVPIAWLDRKKEKMGERWQWSHAIGTMAQCQENGTNGWTVRGCHWGLVAEVRGRSSRWGGIAASCLNCCLNCCLLKKFDVDFDAWWACNAWWTLMDIDFFMASMFRWGPDNV